MRALFCSIKQDLLLKVFAYSLEAPLRHLPSSGSTLVNIEKYTSSKTIDPGFVSISILLVQLDH